MSVSRRWGELGQLLSDDPHLLAIDIVRCNPLDFLADRGADASACGSLAQGGAYRLGVRQASGSDDLEGGR